MKNKKRIHELLKLALDLYQDSNDSQFSGMCAVAMHLGYSAAFPDVSLKDKDILEEYIWSHPPFWFRIYKGNMYFWMKYKRKPRIKWLKRHIRKTK